MRAGPTLPLGVCRPVAAGLAALSASPWASGGWNVLTTCCAEGCLLGSGRSGAGVGAALCDDLVGGLLVVVGAVGVGDAGVQGVELVAGAEVGVAGRVAAQVLPA